MPWCPKNYLGAKAEQSWAGLENAKPPLDIHIEFEIFKIGPKTTKLAQMGTCGLCPGILGNARACLVGHLGRKLLSQAQSSKVQA